MILIFILVCIGLALLSCIFYSYYITDIKYYKTKLREENTKRAKIDQIIRNNRNLLLDKQTKLKSIDKNEQFLYEQDYIKVLAQLDLIKKLEEEINYEV